MSEFYLKTEPERCIVFASEKLGEEPVIVDLKLTNIGPRNVAFKVKCTSNELFCIRPSMGLLSASKSEIIQLVFNQTNTIPESGKHYFAVYYIFADLSGSKNARELWTDCKGSPEATRRIFVSFKKEKLDGESIKAEGSEKMEEEAIFHSTSTGSEEVLANKEENDDDKREKTDETYEKKRNDTEVDNEEEESEEEQ